MKKKSRKLQLSKETLHGLELQQAVGAATQFACETRSQCVTNCPGCGQTNYITCLTCADCTG